MLSKGLKLTLRTSKMCTSMKIRRSNLIRHTNYVECSTRLPIKLQTVSGGILIVPVHYSTQVSNYLRTSQTHAMRLAGGSRGHCRTKARQLLIYPCLNKCSNLPSRSIHTVRHKHIKTITFCSRQWPKWHCSRGYNEAPYRTLIVEG